MLVANAFAGEFSLSYGMHPSHIDNAEQERQQQQQAQQQQQQQAAVYHPSHAAMSLAGGLYGPASGRFSPPFSPHHPHSLPALLPVGYYAPSFAPLQLQHFPYHAAAAHALPAGASHPKALRNLHVDNLPAVSEGRLRALFSSYGRILRVRVVCDPVTKAHAGYGFVMFDRQEEARAAMEGMDGLLVFSDRQWEGKEVTHTQPASASAAAAATAPAMQQQQEQEEEGRASNADAASDASPAAASSAKEAEVETSASVEEVEAGEVESSRLDGAAAASPSSASGLSSSLPVFRPPASATVNADGTYTLPSGILLSAAGQIGKRLRVTLARQRRNASLGSGWEQLQHRVSHAAALPLALPLLPQPPPVNTNLYIAGLPQWFTSQQLDGLFSSFGSILESRILLDRHSGNSRGVGFVRFDNQLACNAAIQAWNGRCPVPGGQPITVRYAMDKSGSQQQQQQHQHLQQHQLQHAAAEGAGGGRGGGGRRQRDALQAAELLSSHSPPSPDDLHAMLSGLQLQSYYPHFMPPVSPISPPDSPLSYTAMPSPLSPSARPTLHSSSSSSSRTCSRCCTRPRCPRSRRRPPPRRPRPQARYWSCCPHWLCPACRPL